MAEYNGHRSWNAWNVSLWIGNDEGLYRTAVECWRKSKNADHATRLFGLETGLIGSKTPDGATYNVTSVKAALVGLELTRN